MAQRQLNVRSDEAADKAARLARELGKTTTEVVVEALRSYERATLDDKGWTSDKRRRFDALQALATETSGHLIPGSPEDHDWLYDDNGLPR